MCPDSVRCKAQRCGRKNHQAAKLSYKSTLHDTQSLVHVVLNVPTNMFLLKRKPYTKYYCANTILNNLSLRSHNFTARIFAKRHCATYIKSLTQRNR